MKAKMFEELLESVRERRSHSPRSEETLAPV
jgi:hypothetical protein